MSELWVRHSSFSSNTIEQFPNWSLCQFPQPLKWWLWYQSSSAIHFSCYSPGKLSPHGSTNHSLKSKLHCTPKSRPELSLQPHLRPLPISYDKWCHVLCSCIGLYSHFLSMTSYSLCPCFCFCMKCFSFLSSW